MEGFAAPNDVAWDPLVLLLPDVVPPNLKGSDVFDDPVCPNENAF